MRQTTIKQRASFKELVLRAVKDIPKGKTLSYKEVANRTGNPNASRAVGMIMSRNKDVSIPCHRVIRSDGKIGEYNGLRGGKVGSKAKAKLLLQEKFS